MGKKLRVTSGVTQLDRLLGGLFIGDNVVWHDDAGSLASVFCMNFIQASEAQEQPIIYVTFDRSPRNLLEKLGALAENPYITILDCFTCGKGASSKVFLKFYERDESEQPCRIIKVEEPGQVDKFMHTFYAIHDAMEGDVRFVFESLTGMQELWGGEDQIINFYSHSCPRLYELNTVAYWILEKKAHSPRLRARINQIAQVAIDLSIKKGTPSLTILKAEKRDLEKLNRTYNYWSKDLNVTFDSEQRSVGGINLGIRLKQLRSKRGLSQTEMARLIGVTPSSISQFESNQIYPSLPALLKMAEVLSVQINAFFQDSEDVSPQVVYLASEAVEVKLTDLPNESVHAKLLTPIEYEPKAEPYLIEIPPNQKVPAHFFIHKGEELGYLLSGKLHLKLKKAAYTVNPGDVIHLTSEIPTRWENPGPTSARLLWIKVK
jgi:transcriptional regulator with XRE-family HTH domain/KaiC/GvpD/RAD55 family RecA-like ATPase